VASDNQPEPGTPDAFEQAAAQAHRQKHILRLYVSGMSPRSIEAVTNLKAICDEHLAGLYDLEVIDLYKNPELASAEQIIATPTLIKKLPEPLRTIVGDLSNRERVLIGLDLRRG